MDQRACDLRYPEGSEWSEVLGVDLLVLQGKNKLNIIEDLKWYL